MAPLHVEEFFRVMQEKLSLRLANSPRGLIRQISQKDIHRPGLALAGFIDLFTFDRVQIIGNTEIRYLATLTLAQQNETVRRILQFEIPCVLVTSGNALPGDMARIADASGVCIFTTPLSTTDCTHLLSEYLDHKFAPSMTVHGSLVDVYGTGLLFTGRSGIGKSEVSLDLVERGHRLVSDDLVHLTRMADNVLMGHGADSIRHYMEIRGVGIIDVARMFGVRGIRIQKRVETEVELVDWSADEDYDRTGIEIQYKEYLGVNIPYVRLPIFPGKNVTVIAETIALNLHLRVYGMNPAKMFSEALTQAMNSGNRLDSYLEKDFE
jgi:HPr kinase/phosphorylase